MPGMDDSTLKFLYFFDGPYWGLSLLRAARQGREGGADLTNDQFVVCSPCQETRIMTVAYIL